MGESGWGRTDRLLLAGACSGIRQCARELCACASSFLMAQIRRPTLVRGGGMLVSRNWFSVSFVYRVAIAIRKLIAMMSLSDKPKADKAGAGSGRLSANRCWFFGRKSGLLHACGNAEVVWPPLAGTLFLAACDSGGGDPGSYVVTTNSCLPPCPSSRAQWMTVGVAYGIRSNSLDSCNSGVTGDEDGLVARADVRGGTGGGAGESCSGPCCCRCSTAFALSANSWSRCSKAE
ncbi:hypothetical protein ACUXQ2_001894 [Cupriavidus metallidurans]